MTQCQHCHSNVLYFETDTGTGDSFRCVFCGFIKYFHTPKIKIKKAGHLKEYDEDAVSVVFSKPLSETTWWEED